MSLNPTATELIRIFGADRWEAHRRLFAHRHPAISAPFHPELVEDFWAADPYSVFLAFRGSAKSTIGEEDMALAVAERCFKNMLIIGASEARAAERLAAVSYELANNDLLIELYGEQKGPVWTQTKLVTMHGVCLQALGRDQDIRGIKHLDHRPDFVFVDDFEDKDSVQTPEGRAKTMRWFLAELLPACAPQRRVRIRATPMDAESVPMRLIREMLWPNRIRPIEYFDEAGRRRASWPAAYPLAWIDRERQNYVRVGEIAAWEREYMCRATSDADTPFKKEQMRVVPRERSWQATYAMLDPARTIGRNSATTGWAVWSWLQNRLVIWAGDAQLLLPDEIVKLGFEIARLFDPIWLGAERDGLEQFLLQPFRQEMVARGVVLPLRGIKAPVGKLDFIRGLQPFFAAGEVEFAQHCPTLQEQLLNFPRGRIDGPNALAYALTLRPGLPIYSGFTQEHVEPEPDFARDMPAFLAANATGAIVTAALTQVRDGRLVVLADWLREGSPADVVQGIHEEAAAVAGGERLVRPGREDSWEEMLKAAAPARMVLRQMPPRWVVPPRHADRYNNVGLHQAIRALPAEARYGGAESGGQAWLSAKLGQQVRGRMAVAVSPQAKWTCRALSGGYARALVHGTLQPYAEEGPYRTLMEGLESFLGIGRLERETGLASGGDEDDTENWSYDRHGRRYRSAMPAR